jgi:multiple sugar transport system ATP-binding protein
VVQQVGTPIEIYDRPANIFVAGFIGSPAMNLVPGVISNGVFEAKGVTLSAAKGLSDGPITLGFRAEDAKIAGGGMSGSLYSLELLGDSSMVTMDCGDTHVVVKVAKEYRASIGQTVSASVEPPNCQWFDSVTGSRISIKTQE